MKAPLVICAAVVVLSIAALVVSRNWWMLIAVGVSAGCLIVVYGMQQGRRD
ncbi:MAG TPA: hypothetical protein VFR40_06080 [Lapillicoccus sp.]|nr:hypothetical protein [Lapillicoccus sp.]